MTPLYTKPRGRANSRVPLGPFIKKYLTDHSEAPLSDIHRAYKAALVLAYPEKVKKRSLHQSHYMSFYRYCAKLRSHGFLEEVRREPATPTGGNLSMTVDGHDQATGKLSDSYRVVYKLTTAGIAEPDTGKWRKP